MSVEDITAQPDHSSLVNGWNFDIGGSTILEPLYFRSKCDSAIYIGTSEYARKRWVAEWSAWAFEERMLQEFIFSSYFG